MQSCLREFEEHFYAPVCISMYNKDLETSLKSEDNRPDHDMRDHDALRDACHFLLLAADIIEPQTEAVVRLLFNEVPFFSSPRVKNLQAPQCKLPIANCFDYDERINRTI